MLDEQNLIKMFKNYGGWPLLEGGSWNESNFDWLLTVYKFQKNRGGFISSKIYDNEDENGEITISITIKVCLFY